VPAHPIVLPPPEPGHPIVIPPDAISPGVPAHPIVLPPPSQPQTFTVAIRNDATGEYKVMTFVPGDVPPATPGAGPK
jgi:hypothetical protein